MDTLIESLETKKEYYIEKRGDMQWERMYHAKDWKDAIAFYKGYIKGNGCILRIMKKTTTVKIKQIRTNNEKKR